MLKNRLMKIVQMSQCRWQIENDKGFILTYNLTLESAQRAEEYIRNYVSSFLNYNYEVVPLKQEKKGDGK